jgi:hypothetical protein
MRSILHTVLRDSNFLNEVRYYLSATRSAEAIKVVQLRLAQDISYLYGLVAVVREDEIVLYVPEHGDEPIVLSRNPSQVLLNDAHLVVHMDRGIVSFTYAPEYHYAAVTGLASSGEGTGGGEPQEDTSLQYYSNSVH